MLVNSVEHMFREGEESIFDFVGWRDPVAPKEDVLAEVIPIAAYATTVRRMALDFAAKIVRSGGGIALKIPRAVMEVLKFEWLWLRCNHPPPIMQ